MPAGRPKGAMNKRSRSLEHMVRRQYPNYNAILELVGIALDPKTPRTEKIAANKEVAGYLYPKLKAIEITQETDKKMTIEWMMPDGTKLTDQSSDGSTIEQIVKQEVTEEILDDD